MASAQPNPEGGYDPAFYEDLYRAEDSHFWFTARNRIVGDAVRSAFAGRESERLDVLEIGCGSGNVTRVLQAALPNARVVGVDLFADGFAYARSRGVRRLVHADIARSPFRGGFDLVGMFDVLEHIPDDETALANAHRILRPGGILLLTVPAHMYLWSYFDEASHHCRRYECADLAARAKAAGFEVEYATEFMTALHPVMRLQRWIKGRGRKPTQREALEMTRSDLAVRPLANGIFGALTALERPLLRKRRTLRRGTSILLLARRSGA